MNRALLIASQTAGLRGCHADVGLMADVLREWDFECTTVIGGDATQAGILRAYRDLIDETGTGDAAVVYYSGHGGRIRNVAATDDPAAAYWQFIVPTDFESSTPDEFHGILAEELRALQLELSTKTDNVTTILDCCHAALMSRDPACVARFLPRPWAELRPGAIARWEQADTALRAALARPGTVPADTESNQRAVRVVACLPTESAFELASGAADAVHGLLTVNLAALLRDAKEATPSAHPVTWADLAAPLRARVLSRVGQQHVLVEGPSRRRLFATEQPDRARGWPVEIRGASIRLPGAVFIGVGPGDTVALVDGGRPDEPVVAATVERLEAGRAVLTVTDRAVGAALGPGTVAHPVTLSAGRHPVVVDARAPGAAAVRAAIGQSARVELADPSTAAPLARVVVDDAGLMLVDLNGMPQYAKARPVTAAGLRALVEDLEHLARAAVLRELASGTGAEELDIPVAFTVHADPAGPPLENGTTLTLGSVFVRVHHHGRTHDRPVFVNVVDLGQVGDVTVLSADASPTGIQLSPGQSYQLYGAEGAWLSWPDGLPPDEPRPETFMAIFSDSEHDLRPVATTALVSRAGTGGVASSAGTLQRYVDLATSASTRSIGERPAHLAEALRYRVERFEFLLDPGFQLEAPAAGRGRGGTRGAPVHLAIRLLELVRRDQVAFSTDVRLDAVFVSGCPIEDGRPFVARTFRLPDGALGAKLDLFDGPAQGHLEIALWVSRARPEQPDLAELLASAGNGLATRTVPVGDIVETAGRLLRRVANRSVALYRTTLAVPAEVTAGRRPAAGLLEALDLAFAYDIVSQPASAP